MHYSATILEQGVLRGIPLLQKCVCPCLLLLTEQGLHKMQYLVQSLLWEPSALSILKIRVP